MNGSVRYKEANILTYHGLILYFFLTCMAKGSFTLKRSKAESSKDRNKNSEVTIKLQRSHAAQRVDMLH